MAVNQVLGDLGLEKHPDKSFIGRIERGFKRGRMFPCWPARMVIVAEE
jgi:hypothetical protein